MLCGSYNFHVACSQFYFYFVNLKHDYDSHDQNHLVPNHTIISQDHDHLI